MRAPREPGFYWVVVPSRRRLAVAEWSPSYAPGKWAFPGLPDTVAAEEVPSVVSERLEPPS